MFRNEFVGNLHLQALPGLTDPGGGQPERNRSPKNIGGCMVLFRHATKDTQRIRLGIEFSMTDPIAPDFPAQRCRCGPLASALQATNSIFASVPRNCPSLWSTMNLPT